MKVVLFGASGKVGQLVARLLLDEGYEVIAVVHRSNLFPVQPHLKIQEVDVHNAKTVAAVVGEGDVVMSTLGSWHTKSADILTSAMQSIIPAMEVRGTKRIISLTGSSAFFSDEHPTFIQLMLRLGLMVVNKRVILDGEQHMQLLRASGLDWTVIRSPVMNTKGTVGYELTARLGSVFATINREAVARAMVAQLSDATWLRQAPTIWRSKD